MKVGLAGKNPVKMAFLARAMRFLVPRMRTEWTRYDHEVALEPIAA